MEGSAVVLWPGWTRWPVVRQPPELLMGGFTSLVVVGTELVRTSSFGVRMPEIDHSNVIFHFPLRGNSEGVLNK